MSFVRSPYELPRIYPLSFVVSLPDTPRWVISTKTSILNPLRLALKFLLLIIDHRGLLKCSFLHAFKHTVGFSHGFKKSDDVIANISWLKFAAQLKK